MLKENLHAWRKCGMSLCRSKFKCKVDSFSASQTAWPSRLAIFVWHSFRHFIPQTCLILATAAQINQFMIALSVSLCLAITFLEKLWITQLNYNTTNKTTSPLQRAPSLRASIINFFILGLTDRGLTYLGHRDFDQLILELPEILHPEICPLATERTLQGESGIG